MASQPEGEGKHGFKVGEDGEEGGGRSEAVVV